MECNIIVAASENNVIGKNNTLPWHLKNDLMRFKQLTTNGCVIMGRKCYESIGKPLPNRTNIIVSRNKDLIIPGCIVKNSVKEAIELGNELNPKVNPFVIGGGMIYEQALPYAKAIHFTRVHTYIEGDTFFPEIDYIKDGWEQFISTVCLKDEHNDYDSTYTLWVK